MLIRNVERSSAAVGRAAFTLMELIVVTVILLILLGIATPMYFSYVESSKLKVARSEAIMLAGELEKFRLDKGDFPVPGTWESLPLKKQPVDPWGMSYNWTVQQQQVGESVLPISVVWSFGPNKADDGGGGDDISSQQ